jgi:CRISPR/Cas system type I-B associated protein Csh2 (Cas7 group RAMP superfamily)
MKKIVEQKIDNLKDTLYDYYEEIFWGTEAKHNEDFQGRDRYCEEMVAQALVILGIKEQ